MTQMKSPLDQGQPSGLILSGFGVRAPSQTHTLILYWPEYVHYSRLHGVNCPQPTTPVKYFGPTSAPDLAPLPFVGRTRLSVNQGDEKQNIRGALETGAYGKTVSVDTLGGSTGNQDDEWFLTMSSDWYQAGVEAENLIGCPLRSGDSYA